jgi:hypothetical protein
VASRRRKFRNAVAASVAAAGGGRVPLIPERFGWFDCETLLSQPNDTPVNVWPNEGTEGDATPITNAPQFFTTGGPGNGNDCRVEFDRANTESLQTALFGRKPQPGLMMWVVRVPAFADRYSVFDGRETPSANWHVEVLKNNGRVRVNAGATIQSTVSVGNAWWWGVAQLDGRNGRLVTSTGLDLRGDVGTMANNGIILGERGTGGQNFNGDMALAGWFSNAPVSLTQWAIGYLQNRFAL